MPKKKLDVIGLRAIRKSTHLGGKTAHKAGHLLNRLESKANRMVTARTGSADGSGSVPISEFVHSKFPYITPIHPALPEINQKPSVTVFVPSLSPKGFYGGIATLLIVSATLAEKLGYDYRVVQTSGFEKSHTVLSFLSDHGISIPANRFHTLDVSYRTPYNFAYLPIHPEDIVVVSAWWDAYTASKLPLKKKFVYMIQDFEPIFYNNSDAYLMAESTYHSENFIPLCNTKIMYDYMSSNGYAYVEKTGLWFEPAVSRNSGKNSGKHNKHTKKQLFIYGRPSVERNLFYHALLAVDLAFQNEILNSDEWECFMAGEDSSPNIRLSSGLIIQNKGKMGLDEYIDFANTIDLAISLMMAPHPSYPPLELASLGSAVVTTKYANKKSVSNYSDNIVATESDVNSLVEGIKKATRLTTKTGLNLPLNWAAALEKPLEQISKMY